MTYSARDARDVVALLVGEPAGEVEEGDKGEEEDGGGGEEIGCHVCWQDTGREWGA